VRKPHAAQHIGRLGELDIVVADDLDAIAPGVAEVEEGPGQGFDAGLGHRPADRVLVVDHQAEVAAVVRGLLSSPLEGQELVAQVDEGHVLAFPAQLEREQPPVERQRFVDVADFERDVIETDGRGLSWLPAWGSSRVERVWGLNGRRIRPVPGPRRDRAARARPTRRGHSGLLRCGDVSTVPGASAGVSTGATSRPTRTGSSCRRRRTNGRFESSGS